jgi:hypothetical protein
LRTFRPNNKHKKNECASFIFDHFKNVKQQKRLITFSFAFKNVTEDPVLKEIMTVAASSSPGISEIPMKVLKSSSQFLAPILMKLFNHCIHNGAMPDE